MKPLVTQKIEFGVRVKNNEIVGEKTNALERRRWWCFGEKGKLTRSFSIPFRRPAYAAALLWTVSAQQLVPYYLSPIYSPPFCVCITETFNFRYTICFIYNNRQALCPPGTTLSCSCR